MPRGKRLLFQLFLCVCFCLFISNLQVKAAVAEDSRSSQGAFSATGTFTSAAGANTITWDHTIGSGTARALYVTVSATSSTSTCTTVNGVTTCPSPPSLNVGTATVRIVSASYNGIAMTKLTEVFTADNSVAIFRLTDTGTNTLPTTGTYPVVVTVTPGISTYVEGNALSFTGVDQLNPNGTIFQASNPTNTPTDNPSVMVTDSSAGEMVLDILGSIPNAGFMTPGANQKVCAVSDPSESNCTRGREFFNFAFDVGASSTKPGTASSETMSWTLTRAAPWILLATSINAQSGASAAPTTISGRVALPSGIGVYPARVFLTNSFGETVSVRTNQFGFYRFENINVGETYIINISSKLYQFNSQVVNVTEETNKLDFTSIQ